MKFSIVVFQNFFLGGGGGVEGLFPILVKVTFYMYDVRFCAHHDCNSYIIHATTHVIDRNMTEISYLLHISIVLSFQI